MNPRGTESQQEEIANMVQIPEQTTTSATTAQMGMGATDGQAHEFTVMVPLNPGGAERTRKRLEQRTSDEARTRRDAMGNLHDMRVVFFDNDTRMLFATVFDGTLDSYISDFASKMPDQLDALFAECVDYPGIHDPNIMDYLHKYQLEADEFYSAYPNTTVTQVRKGQRVLHAWEALLDTAAD
jgi:hypothetical protein